MSARNFSVALVITLVIAGVGGFGGGWWWFTQRAQPVVVATPTPLPPVLPEERVVAALETDELRRLAGDAEVIRRLPSTMRTGGESPPIAEAYGAVQKAWDRHEERLKEAADPAGYRTSLKERASDAWASRNESALRNLGEDFFRRDLGAWRPSPRKMRRVHLGARGGPDAFRCASCHWQPVLGGGGALADNVFFDGDGQSTTSALVRNPPALQGASLISLLAAEMSADLERISEDARTRAASSNNNVTVALKTKGVTFGELTVAPNGFRDTSRVVGIDEDLVVKPFGWKGTSRNLRDSIEEGLRLQMGLSADDLGSGVVEAMEVFLATLEPPATIPPQLNDQQLRWEAGEKRFETAGCASCHVPYLLLKDPVYRIGEMAIDLADTFGLEKDEYAGGYRVWLYSDLKRHAMGDDLGDTRKHRDIAKDAFRTPALWGLDGTEPFLHDGSGLNSFDSTIAAHGGEAQAARDEFLNGGTQSEAELRAFLRTLTRRPRMRVAGP